MKQFLQKNKKYIALALVVICFVFGPFGGIDTVHAQAACDWIVPALICGLSTVAASLLFIPFIFTSWLLALGGLVLDFVITYTVVDMTRNLGYVTGINIAWATIRDLMNMSFIFILLYTAIGTILDIGGVNWKKNIINIIIAAVLINFSLFFTKILIDASNILTLTFYRIIVPTGAGGGLSYTFMSPLGLTSMFNISDGSRVLEEFGYNLSSVGVVSIGGSAFFVVTAFVFFSVAIMFLIRYITIIFLLILSPVAFMGNLVPKLSDKVGEWWKTLSNQLIFPPVFMMITWVVATIINNSNFTCIREGGGNIQGNFTDLYGAGVTAGGTFSELTGCTTGPIALMVNFIIVIAFIIAALTVSQKIASQGGSAGQKIVMGGLGLGAAGAALASRKSLGYAANYADKKGLLRGLDGAAAGQGFAKSIQTQGLGRGILAGAKTYGSRAAVSTTRGAATGNLDIRSGLNAVGGFVGAKDLSSEFGFGNQFSDAGKGGVAGAEKDKKKAADRDQVVKTNNARTAIEAGVAEANAAKLAGRAPTQSIIDNMEQALSNLSDKEITALVESNGKLLNDPHFIEKLSSQQVQALNKSDSFTEAQKNGMKRTRFAAAETRLPTTATPAQIKAREDAIKNLSDKDLEMIDPVHLTDPNFVKNLKTSQVDAIQKSDKFTGSQKKFIKDEKARPFNSAMTIDPATGMITDPITAAAIFRGKDMSMEQKAKLPITQLTNPAILMALDKGQLKRMADKMDPADVATLGAAIQAEDTRVETSVTISGRARTTDELRLKATSDWLKSPAGAETFS